MLVHDSFAFHFYVISFKNLCYTYNTIVLSNDFDNYHTFLLLLFTTNTSINFQVGAHRMYESNARFYQKMNWKICYIM